MKNHSTAIFYTTSKIKAKELKCIFWKLVLAAAASENEITFNSIF